jgi:hypothetical protein
MPNNLRRKFIPLQFLQRPAMPRTKLTSDAQN